ncbi:hypothetical protein [Aureimonas sp. SK2]|uniref:hypothetical protein n=1 Tax=Aureimonas sp. SK2 TaxID=3015992 RepID=UPI0024439D5A|nr:hypothetical protein [Aureimonas sp. SK2]
MVQERRFRGFTLAHVETLEARDDGTIAMIGLSGSGDAVAMIVQPEAIDDLVSRLRSIRPSMSSNAGQSSANPLADLKWDPA